MISRRRTSARQGKFGSANVAVRGCGPGQQANNLFDPIICYGNASDRRAAAVKKDVATRIFTRTEDAVGSVRIIDVKAQEEIALRVEPIQFVTALRHLFVPEAALGSQSSRRRTNSIFVYELERLVLRIRRPKLQEAFLFEALQQNEIGRASCRDRVKV